MNLVATHYFRRANWSLFISNLALLNLEEKYLKLNPIDDRVVYSAYLNSMPNNSDGFE